MADTVGSVASTVVKVRKGVDMILVASDAVLRYVNMGRMQTLLTKAAQDRSLVEATEWLGLYIQGLIPDCSDLNLGPCVIAVWQRPGRAPRKQRPPSFANCTRYQVAMGKGGGKVKRVAFQGSLKGNSSGCCPRKL